MDDGEDVARNELAQHMVSGRHELEGRREARRRLVLVRARATGGLQHQLVERQNALETKHLLHAVLGMEVDDVHAAKMPLGIRIDHVIRDDTRILDRGVVGLTDDCHHLVGVFAEELRRLASTGDELDLFRTVAIEVLDALLGGALHLYVVAAGQAAVGADHNHQRSLVNLGVDEQWVGDIDRRILRNGQHDVRDGGGIRLGILLALERASDLSRSHHFHRARDLLGRGDRVDALFYVAEVSHGA